MTSWIVTPHRPLQGSRCRWRALNNWYSFFGTSETIGHWFGSGTGTSAGGAVEQRRGIPGAPRPITYVANCKTADAHPCNSEKDFRCPNRSKGSNSTVALEENWACDGVGALSGRKRTSFRAAASPKHHRKRLGTDRGMVRPYLEGDERVRTDDSVPHSWSTRMTMIC